MPGATMTKKFSRGEFLRGLIKPVQKLTYEDRQQEQDYLQFLPPEFTDALLRREVERLGYDPDKLTKNQMAGLILGTMASSAGKPD